LTDLLDLALLHYGKTIGCTTGFRIIQSTVIILWAQASLAERGIFMESESSSAGYMMAYTEFKVILKQPRGAPQGSEEYRVQ